MEAAAVEVEVEAKVQAAGVGAAAARVGAVAARVGAVAAKVVAAQAPALATAPDRGQGQSHQGAPRRMVPPTRLQGSFRQGFLSWGGQKEAQVGDKSLAHGQWQYLVFT